MIKAILPAGVGVLLVVVALFLGGRTRAFVRRATAVPGVVERLNASGTHPQIYKGTAQIDAIGALWFDSIGLSFVGLIALLVGAMGMITHFSHRK